MDDDSHNSTAPPHQAHPLPTDNAGQYRQLRAYLLACVALSVAVAALVIWLDCTNGHDGVDWRLFTIVATALLVTEINASGWLRLGAHGSTVTPTWGLSFALLLLGTPTGAIAAMGMTTALMQIVGRRGLLRLAFNVGQTALSLALGALVLYSFSIDGPVLDGFSLPFVNWLALVLSAITVVSVNAALTSYPVSIIENAPYRTILRTGMKLSLSADAAMLCLAPVLVVSGQVSLLLLPLIAIAAFLVYRTANEAMVRGHEADHDGLTQLLNRRAFIAELDKFVADPAAETGAVMILDLDRFKEVNDRLGHETGDHVLQAFGQRLATSLPPGSVTARLGGDEFAVLVRIGKHDDVSAAIEAMHAQLSQPLPVDGFPLATGTSIGAAIFPAHGETSTELLHAADIAMYRAKLVRSGVAIYQVSGTTKDHGRVSLLADLTSAIENREFVIHYQPQVSLETGRIVAVEALVRWDHPVLGRIAPGEFISLAEQTELIDPLTELVMKLSVEEIAPLGSDVSLAVNVSARNLLDRHFAANTLALLERMNFPADRFEIELTESSIAQDPEHTVATFDELRGAGVRVSVDDFGTGYSSFATLRDLDVDRIKIDRSLVVRLADSERDRRILGSILDLAHALGSEVVAEGVESDEVWSYLADSGCDVVQGFVVAHPVPLATISEMLTDGVVISPPSPT